jgi:TatD DNase family protein
MLIDAHAHLDIYGEDLDRALGQIEERSILTLSNSMDLASYEKNLEIARRSRMVVPLFGVHPWQARENLCRLDELDDAIGRTPMLGEIGLDHRFVEDESLYPAQRGVFEFLLAAARDSGKSVNIHTSGAEKEVLTLLDEYDIERVVVHWYSGPMDVFHALSERGAFFTMGIHVAHADHIRELASAVPSGQLLTETDNPGGPEWLLGAPGYPTLLLDVIDALANARGVSSQEIIETVERNFAEFVSRDPHLSKACSCLLSGGE